MDFILLYLQVYVVAGLCGHETFAMSVIGAGMMMEAMVNSLLVSLFELKPYYSSH